MSAVRETELDREFVPKRVERCACGDFLSADPSDRRAVWLAVTRHRQSYRHQEWLAVRESEG